MADATLGRQATTNHGIAYGIYKGPCLTRGKILNINAVLDVKNDRKCHIFYYQILAAES